MRALKRRTLPMVFIISCAIALVSIHTFTLEYCAGIVVGAFLLWYCLKFPPLTVSVFLVIYTLQTTVFTGTQVMPAKAFYPLYLLMITNAFRGIGKDYKKLLSLESAAYALFIVMVFVGVIWSPAGIELNKLQRMFIYVLGFLTALQFRSTGQRLFFYWVAIINSTILSLWTINNALTTNFAYRSGVQTNYNYVATIICIGVIPSLHLLLNKESTLKLSKVFLALSAALGIYANVLLQSRGVAIALTFAIIMLLLVRKWRLKTLAVAGILGAAGWFFLQQSAMFQDFISRFHGQDVNSFDGRLPIWQASWFTFKQSSIAEQLFGHGMGFSQVVAQAVTLYLNSAHNLYIEFLLDYGAIGLIAFLALTVFILWTLLSTKSRLAGLGISYIVFLLCCGLTATSGDNFLFWIVIGTTLFTQFDETSSQPGAENNTAIQPASIISHAIITP